MCDQLKGFPLPTHPSPELSCCSVQVLGIIGRERVALEVQLATEGGEPEACFIEEALALLAVRQGRLHDAYSHQDLAHCMQQVALLEQSSTSGEHITNEATAGATEDPMAALDGGNQHASENCPDPTNVQSQKRLSNKKKYKKKNRNKSTPNEQLNTVSSYESIFELPPLKPSEAFNNKTAVFTDGEASINSNSDNSLSTSPEFVSGDLSFLTMKSSPGEMSSQTEISDYNEIEKPLNMEFLQFQLETEKQLEFESDKELTCITAGITKSISSPADLASPTARNDSLPPVDDQEKSSLGDKRSQPKTCVGRDVDHFYQASDGSHVYLHPLNMAMLNMHYGRADQLPLSIQAHVIEKVSTGTCLKKIHIHNNIPQIIN